MALFKKKATNKEPEPEAVQESAAQPERKVQQATLSSGRMAAVFLRLYRWIFSVSLSLDVYQIESGEDVCGGQPLPVRGYYHDLLSALSACVLEEQRASFEARFAPNAIQRAAELGSTAISGIFCASFDPAPPAAEGEEVTPPEPALAWFAPSFCATARRETFCSSSISETSATTWTMAALRKRASILPPPRPRRTGRRSASSACSAKPIRSSLNTKS